MLTECRQNIRNNNSPKRDSSRTVSCSSAVLDSRDQDYCAVHMKKTHDPELWLASALASPFRVHDAEKRPIGESPPSTQDLLSV